MVRAEPDILGHNLETVPRLYPIRQGADYGRSLSVLAACRDLAPAIKTKSGVMVGLGETEEELLGVFRDLREGGVFLPEYRPVSGPEQAALSGPGFRRAGEVRTIPGAGACAGIRPCGKRTLCAKFLPCCPVWGVIRRTGTACPDDQNDTARAEYGAGCVVSACRIT